jgi:redox-sensitive bicupin YhaK (pirin superfamily)
MKTLIKRSSDRVHKKDLWKESWYAFFPHQSYFGKLTGFSEDIVEAGKGFGLHPHQNMEIATIVTDGAQMHEDTTGSKHTLDSLSVQSMSAGRGIYHSEVNASTTVPFHSFQIWVLPELMDVAPRHEVFRFKPGDRHNQVLTVISPDRRDGSIYINQDVYLGLSTLDANYDLVYELKKPTHGLYVHVVKGEIIVGETVLQPGDAMGVYETHTVPIRTAQPSELIFVETPVDDIRFEV